MNTPTLVASLIMALVVVLIIALRDPSDHARMAATCAPAVGTHRAVACAAGLRRARDHPGHQGPLRRQHARATMAGPGRRRRSGLPQQGDADALPGGNHAAAQRRNPDLDPRRVDHGDTHGTRQSRARPSRTTEFSRSGGDCRRVPRSTPVSAATTVATWPTGWRRTRHERGQEQSSFSRTDECSPAPNSAL